jgi:Zn-dependent M28 family amino/carboxypeptidase
VRLVAFANDEHPGARHPSAGGRLHAARLAKDPDADVVAMLSLDMLGVYGPPPASFVALVGDRGSRALMKRVRRAFRSVADVPVHGFALPSFLPLARVSDHASFREWGVPALMVTDTGPLRYRHYHRKTDTPDRLDYERMSEVVRGVAAITASLAGQVASRAPG